MSDSSLSTFSASTELSSRLNLLTILRSRASNASRLSVFNTPTGINRPSSILISVLSISKHESPVLQRCFLMFSTSAEAVLAASGDAPHTVTRSSSGSSMAKAQSSSGLIRPASNLSPILRPIDPSTKRTLISSMTTLFLTLKTRCPTVAFCPFETSILLVLPVVRSLPDVYS